MRQTIRSSLLLLAGSIPLVAGNAQEPERRSSEVGRALITRDVLAAVSDGLAWLASQQSEDGYWTQDVGFKLNSSYRITAPDSPHVGVTALALMSFLAGGHLPGRGQYGHVVERGLDYVLSRVGENGYITDAGTRMYSHAFATLFLAEIYGMTNRGDVRRALQDSVNIIVDSQNAEGGWRYKPFARESDMSITVCQVVALRSARNVGITVSARTIKDAENYVLDSAVSSNAPDRRGRFAYSINDGGAFRYQKEEHSRTTFPLTAAGVTTLHAAGLYDHRVLNEAFEFMNAQMAPFNAEFRDHYFFFYGHYYAVQAYYTAGGRSFVRYYRTMRKILLDMQQSDGRWVCNTGPGDAFATAVSTLILQIPLQFLPIFQR
ncbi:MAG: terpene cyclase/mutase family protein [Planctomycetes bacterium]|nr:terpene cyclase/mutase family protein [Planctomycetota bacterium]